MVGLIKKSRIWSLPLHLGKLNGRLDCADFSYYQIMLLHSLPSVNIDINTLMSGEGGGCADNIYKCIFLNENHCIFIPIS